MEYYVQFMELKDEVWDPEQDITVSVPEYWIELRGINGRYRLDGRKKLSNMVKDAKERLELLKEVYPHINGFKIMKGVRFDDTTTLYKLSLARERCI